MDLYRLPSEPPGGKPDESTCLAVLLCHGDRDFEGLQAILRTTDIVALCAVMTGWAWDAGVLLGGGDADWFAEHLRDRLMRLAAAPE